MTGEQLRGLRDGSLPLAELLAVRGHVQACAACADAVSDAARIDDGVGALRRDLASEPAPSRTMWWLAAAAALLLIVLAAVLFTRRPPAAEIPRAHQEPPPSAPATTTETPRATPQRYANAEWNRAVAQALASGRIPVSAAAIALQREGTPLRNETPVAENARALSPAGEIVRAARPLFTWTLRDGETATVLLFAGDEPVETSAPLRTDRWTPSKALDPAKTYTWQLEITDANGATTLVPTPPSPPALFRVMPAAARAELAEAERLHPGDHLLLAVLAARHGALGEARKHLRSYTTHGPRPELVEE